MAKKVDFRQYKNLEKIVEAVRRSYPDRDVSSAWLDGMEVSDPLFTFLVNEVKSTYDPAASFTDNKAEALRVTQMTARDVLAVVKGLEALKP